VSLTEPVVTLLGQSFSWRDIIMLAGGMFLVWKATSEIHHHMQGGDEEEDSTGAVVAGFATTIFQILLLDVVFSIDSIITAVGMTPHIPIMVVAVVISVAVMLMAATPLSAFISRNPTVVMLALGFLLMIGMTLLAEGFGFHVPKGYIYAAMAFSAGVEALNLMVRRKRRPRLRRPSV
jgi:predicted tellurium resistance membrane protein TerC